MLPIFCAHEQIYLLHQYLRTVKLFVSVVLSISVPYTPSLSDALTILGPQSRTQVPGVPLDIDEHAPFNPQYVGPPQPERPVHELAELSFVAPAGGVLHHQGDDDVVGVGVPVSRTGLEPERPVLDVGEQPLGRRGLGGVSPNRVLELPYLGEVRQPAGVFEELPECE